MPYDKSSPPEKIKGLPAHAQDIWISAFNSAYENTPEGRDKEEYASRVAWSAVEKAGYKKNKEGDWVKMSDVNEPNFDEVEIWQAGEYPQGTFTEKDIDEMVANFDPGYHEPPAIVGHNKEGEDEKPAHAWVEKIWRNGSKLMAKFKQVSNELKTWVKEGKYKKKSIELWDNFEGTGKLVLKAVAFLGQTIPQVKGLQNQFGSFEDAHGKVLCIGLEEKGRKFKQGDIDMTKEEFDNMFAEKVKPLEAKVATLTTENAELKKSQVTQFSDEAKKRKQERIDGVVSQLLKDGKITPAYMDAGFKQFLMAQPDGIVLTLGEENEKKEIPVIDFAIEFFSNKIKGAPVIFKEISKESGDPIGMTNMGISFKVIDPSDQITEDSLDLHEKTVKFMEEYNAKNPQQRIGYKDALFEINRINP